MGNTAVLHASNRALRNANAFTKERTEHAEAVARAHCARARGSGVAHGPCASCEHGENEESEEGAAHPTRKRLAIPGSLDKDKICEKKMDSVFYNVDIVLREHEVYSRNRHDEAITRFTPLFSVAPSHMKVNLQGTKSGLMKSNNNKSSSHYAVFASHMSVRMQIAEDIMYDSPTIYPCYNNIYSATGTHTFELHDIKAIRDVCARLDDRYKCLPQFLEPIIKEWRDIDARELSRAANHVQTRVLSKIYSPDHEFYLTQCWFNHWN